MVVSELESYIDSRDPVVVTYPLRVDDRSFLLYGSCEGKTVLVELDGEGETIQRVDLCTYLGCAAIDLFGKTIENRAKDIRALDHQSDDNIFTYIPGQVADPQAESCGEDGLGATEEDCDKGKIESELKDIKQQYTDAIGDTNTTPVSIRVSAVYEYLKGRILVRQWDVVMFDDVENAPVVFECETGLLITPKALEIYRGNPINLRPGTVAGTIMSREEWYPDVDQPAWCGGSASGCSTTSSSSSSSSTGGSFCCVYPEQKVTTVRPGKWIDPYRPVERHTPLHFGTVRVLDLSRLKLRGILNDLMAQGKNLRIPLEISEEIVAEWRKDRKWKKVETPTDDASGDANLNPSRVVYVSEGKLVDDNCCSHQGCGTSGAPHGGGLQSHSHGSSGQGHMHLHPHDPSYKLAAQKQNKLVAQKLGNIPEGSDEDAESKKQIESKADLIITDTAIPEGTHLVTKGTHLVAAGTHPMAEGIHLGARGTHLVAEVSHSAAEPESHSQNGSEIQPAVMSDLQKGDPAPKDTLGDSTRHVVSASDADEDTVQQSEDVDQGGARQEQQQYALRAEQLHEEPDLVPIKHNGEVVLIPKSQLELMQMQMQLQQREYEKLERQVVENYNEDMSSLLQNLLDGQNTRFWGPSFFSYRFTNLLCDPSDREKEKYLTLVDYYKGNAGFRKPTISEPAAGAGPLNDITPPNTEHFFLLSEKRGLEDAEERERQGLPFLVWFWLINVREKEFEWEKREASNNTTHWKDKQVFQEILDPENLNPQVAFVKNAERFEYTRARLQYFGRPMIAQKWTTASSSSIPNLPKSKSDIFQNERLVIVNDDDMICVSEVEHSGKGAGKNRVEADSNVLGADGKASWCSDVTNNVSVDTVKEGYNQVLLHAAETKPHRQYAEDVQFRLTTVHPFFKSKQYEKILKTDRRFKKIRSTFRGGLFNYKQYFFEHERKIMALDTSQSERHIGVLTTESVVVLEDMWFRDVTETTAKAVKVPMNEGDHKVCCDKKSSGAKQSCCDRTDVCGKFLTNSEPPKIAGLTFGNANKGKYNIDPLVLSNPENHKTGNDRFKIVAASPLLEETSLDRITWDFPATFRYDLQQKTAVFSCDQGLYTLKLKGCEVS